MSTELKELQAIRKLLKRLLVWFEDKQDEEYLTRRKEELKDT